MGRMGRMEVRLSEYEEGTGQEWINLSDLA